MPKNPIKFPKIKLLKNKLGILKVFTYLLIKLFASVDGQYSPQQCPMGWSADGNCGAMVNCLSLNHKCFGTQCCKPTGPGAGGAGTCPVWTKVDGRES
uniref:WAP domain-containing protein n=1 Tax=Meloidogyne incognita TaxID=6306 RepID=A0A914L7N2_MELIC